MDNQGFANDEVNLKTPTARTENFKEEETVVLDDCSLGCIKLKFLNIFRGPKWFLVFLSMAAFMQGVCINGFVNVVITSIERRFGLKSTETGMIASMYDIGSMIIMIPVSFLGGRSSSSKPRWISLGMLCLALGSLIWTIPHFATPLYQVELDSLSSNTTSSSSLCTSDSNESTQECQESSKERGSLSSYRFVFLLGQLLHGFGAAPLITLGTTFMDESVAVKNSPLYIGIFQAWFLIGPAVGYILGGKLLSFHTDFIPDSGLTPLSSLWVGAWWPGFLFSFLGAALCGFLIFCYPSRINKHQTLSRTDQTDVDKSQSIIQGLKNVLLKTLSNPLYILISLAVGADSMLLAGLSAFLPKYAQTQFKLSAGTSAQVVGMLVVPAGATATFLGGWLIKKFKMSRERILIFSAICQLINIPLCCMFMLYCPTLQYVGVNTASASTELSNPLNFNSQCNQDCSCSSTDLDPVCGSDGLMYLSPCFAGCTNIEGRTNFTDCSCINDGISSASKTTCDDDCSYFKVFLVILFLSMFLTFILGMPNVAATLRSVNVEHRSMAIGIQTIIVRLIGGIPGPIMFGYFIDKTCLLWQQSCKDEGSCIVYDNYQFAVFMTSVCVTMKTVSMIFYLLSLAASKKSKIADVPVT